LARAPGSPGTGRWFAEKN